MGIDSATSVVDPRQEAHSLRGLFIADASVFPSASGVNPMLTIMALAHRASRYIAAAC
jgi:choline dehydrogenase-like flavoprotein